MNNDTDLHYSVTSTISDKMSLRIIYSFKKLEIPILCTYGMNLVYNKIFNADTNIYVHYVAFL